MKKTIPKKGGMVNFRKYNLKELKAGAKLLRKASLFTRSQVGKRCKTYEFDCVVCRVHRLADDIEGEASSIEGMLAWLGKK